MSESELDELLALSSPEEMFAWQSPRSRRLGLERGKVSDEELVRLMREDPFLIRRPLVRAGDVLIPGANEKKLAEHFA